MRIWCRESLHLRALLAFPQWVDCVAPRWALCWQSIALLITGMPVWCASAGVHHNAPTLLDHVLTQAHSCPLSLQTLCRTSRCHLQGIESFGGGWAPPVHTQVTSLQYQHPTTCAGTYTRDVCCLSPVPLHTNPVRLKPLHLLLAQPGDGPAHWCAGHRREDLQRGRAARLPPGIHRYVQSTRFVIQYTRMITLLHMVRMCFRPVYIVARDLIGFDHHVRRHGGRPDTDTRSAGAAAVRGRAARPARPRVCTVNGACLDPALFAAAMHPACLVVVTRHGAGGVAALAGSCLMSAHAETRDMRTPCTCGTLRHSHAPGGPLARGRARLRHAHPR